MLDHEGEELEVALGIANDEVIPLEVERGEIAVVILKPLAHQGGTGRRIELVGLAPLPGDLRLAEQGVEQRLVLADLPAVGAAVQLHLDQAQIAPHLDLVAAIVAGHDPNLEVFRVVIPPV